VAIHRLLENGVFDPDEITIMVVDPTFPYRIEYRIKVRRSLRAEDRWRRNCSLG
jgi:hypothetical protein